MHVRVLPIEKFHMLSNLGHMLFYFDQTLLISSIYWCCMRVLSSLVLQWQEFNCFSVIFKDPVWTIWRSTISQINRFLKLYMCWVVGWLFYENYNDYGMHFVMDDHQQFFSAMRGSITQGIRQSSRIQTRSLPCLNDSSRVQRYSTSARYWYNRIIRETLTTCSLALSIRDLDD